MTKPLPVVQPFTLKAVLLIFFLAISFSTASAQSCGCDHVMNPPALRSTPLVIDGEKLNVKPGETICLSSGFYVQVLMKGIFGEPGKPVTIKNCGGLVEIGDATNFGRWYATDIRNSRYFRFTGTGDPNFKYGIKLGKSGDSGLKVGTSTDTEIDHIEIANTGFAGILAKTDYSSNPPVNALEMNNVNIHDTYIHDTFGEGMYLGETKSPGQDFRHLQVWNNIVLRTGFELIQVANVIEDAQVFNNVLLQGGTRNTLFQNKGFQIGDNSVGRYYNNIIIGSKSNSMIIMGSGNIDIYNNYFSSVTGDAAFYIDNRAFADASKPINFYGNYIRDMTVTFPFFMVNNEINPVNIRENKLEGINILSLLDGGAGANVAFSENVNGTVEPLQFVDMANNNFSLSAGSPYNGLGLLEDLTTINKRPVINLLTDQDVDYETLRQVPVTATDADGDGMILEAFNLPPFVSFNDNGGGKGRFTIAPQTADAGMHYKVRVRATDSRGATNTQYFAIGVYDPFGFIPSASASQGNNYPINTLDSLLSTRWAAPADSGQWIKYDLREEKLISSVKIAFYNGASKVYPFNIEVSEDNATWIPVFSGVSTGTSTDFEEFSFDQIQGRYLRIIDRGNSSNSYNEVVINCTPAPVFHSLAPTDDVYLEGRNVYDNALLRVKEDKQISFLRFDTREAGLNESPVVEAHLKLRAVERGYGTLKVYLAEDADWSEKNLNRRDLPRNGTLVKSLTTYFNFGQTIAIDVLCAVHSDGVYDFVLVMEDSKGGTISFGSRETPFKPELALTTLREGTPDRGECIDQPSVLLFGRNDDSNQDVRLFPNPARDRTTLDLGCGRNESVTVEIANQSGRTFFHRTWERPPQFIQLDLNISSMDRGLYYVKVTRDDDAGTTLRLAKY